MTLPEFNSLAPEAQHEAFEKCCVATNWIVSMQDGSPFPSESALMETATLVWNQCSKQDWLEAFTGHPKIGDVRSLQKKFANTKNWAGNEQSGMDCAGLEVIERLANGNQEYEDKFGYIFIVCATGKSASEMLDLLETRLSNDPETELRIAATEQDKITKIRLHKLLSTNG